MKPVGGEMKNEKLWESLDWHKTKNMCRESGI
jgi:hypothetical protein